MDLSAFVFCQVRRNQLSMAFVESLLGTHQTDRFRKTFEPLNEQSPRGR